MIGWLIYNQNKKNYIDMKFFSIYALKFLTEVVVISEAFFV